jgi:hypothetical protein
VADILKGNRTKQDKTLPSVLEDSDRAERVPVGPSLSSKPTSVAHTMQILFRDDSIVLFVGKVRFF